MKSGVEQAWSRAQCWWRVVPRSTGRFYGPVTLSSAASPHSCCATRCARWLFGEPTADGYDRQRFFWFDANDVHELATGILRRPHGPRIRAAVEPDEVVVAPWDLDHPESATKSHVR